MGGSSPRCVSDLISRRRRGAELEDAICRAAFEELTESGYGAFTIESVAARAQTGKASIYRRWPGKDELLLDAFCRGIPEPVDCFSTADLADSMSTRDVLLCSVREMVGHSPVPSWPPCTRWPGRRRVTRSSPRRWTVWC